MKSWLDLLDASGADVEAAREAMRRGGQALAEAELLARGLSRGELLRALAAASGAEPVDLVMSPPDPVEARRLPEWFVRRHRCLAVAAADGGVVLACQDPADLPALDAASTMLGVRVTPRVALAQDIDAALLSLAGTPSPVRNGPSPRVPASTVVVGGEEEPGLLGSVLAEAARRGATDVHVQPSPDGAEVVLRVDGVLTPTLRLAPGEHAVLVRRAKALSGMDPSVDLRPQDGRVTALVWGEQLDLRVATMPTVHGERMTVRVLRPRAVALGVTALGLAPDQVERLAETVSRDGLVLVCGPAGSGKTTTLAAIVRDMIRGRHVISVEDPVEYLLASPWVTQVETNPRAGRGFADVLRAALRHDPEVLVVGEIRDGETAQLAVRYALSGHLVIATTHAGGPGAALRRLLDWGVTPGVLGGAVRLTVNQRLLRRLCRVCGGAGCGDCWGSGYRGRIGVFELRQAGEARHDGDELVARALALVRDGTTTHREVERVLGDLARTVRKKEEVIV